MKNVTAFIASPVAISSLFYYVNNNSLVEIVCCDHGLLDSMSIFNKKIKITATPKIGKLPLLLFYVAKILTIKIKKGKILLTHECCLPFLDIAIILLRPLGLIVHLLNNNSRHQISFEEYPHGNTKMLLKLLAVKNNFLYFKEIWTCPTSGKALEKFVLAIREYPSTIETAPPPNVLDIKKYEIQSFSKGSKRIAILLMDRYHLNDDDLINLYQRVADLLIKSDFDCFTKDHPNKNLRLGADLFGCVALDPNIPLELFGEMTATLIGIASTAIATFSGMSISILHLIPEASEVEVRQHKYFLEVASKGKDIVYPRSFDELADIVKKSTG